MDALNPFKSLPSQRFKVMYVHLTNVYDNLPFDELVRRDGRHYIVETRGYHSRRRRPTGSCAEFGIARADIPGIVERMFEEGPSAAGEGARGVAFWRASVGRLPARGAAARARRASKRITCRRG